MDKLSGISPDESVEIALDRKLCRAHFYHFLRRAWEAVYENEEFVDGWHIGAICYHIQALIDGKAYSKDGDEADTLIINVPPGCGKSRVVSVMLSAWLWARDPSAGQWYASFGYGVLDRDALDARRLIESEWFKKRFWSDGVSLTDDQNQKRRYNNTAGGWRLAASIGSKSGFGEHPKLLVCLPYEQKIQTSLGSMPIGKIVDERIGCKILSYNHETGKTEWSEIEKYESSPGRELIEVSSENGMSMNVTLDHPVFVCGSGYVPATAVSVGNTVIAQRHGEFEACDDVAVSSTRKTGIIPEKVYNLRVKKNHNYFAGGILVHNCDDPHDPEQALSEQRLIAIDAWDNKYSTRGVVKGVKKVVIAQRLGEGDLCGHIIENEDDIVHLKIPMWYEEDKACETDIEYSDIDEINAEGSFVKKRGWSDPRSEDGELMWPHVMTEKKVGKLKSRLRTAHMISAQLQQNPTSPEGDMFQADWISYVDAPPTHGTAVRAWDKASTINKRSDFTAGCLVVYDGDFFYICDMRRFKKERRDREATIMQIAQADEQIYTDYTLLFEQTPSSDGKDSSEMQGAVYLDAGFRVRIDKPSTNKVARAESLADMMAGGRVKIVRGSWNSKFVSELLSFPEGRHDDQVDAASMAIRKAQKSVRFGKINRPLLALSEEEVEQMVEEEGGEGDLFGGLLDFDMESDDRLGVKW